MSSAIPIEATGLELIEPVGRGAWSEVWRARQVATGAHVALKVLTRQAADQGSRALFRRELRAIAALDHPSIVQLLGFGEITEAVAAETRLEAEQPYLALEFVEGVGLDLFDGPLPFPTLRSILLDLLDGLAHAHARGVLHRDLKPANVMLSDGRVKLTDFGVAGPLLSSRNFRVTRQTDPMMVGTPHYMAPEQIEGRWRDQGPWTDLYSLGCMAFEMVAGRAPFDGPTVMATLIAHVQHAVPPLTPLTMVPADFEPWLRRLLEKSPDLRYRRAADAAWDLLAMSLPTVPGPSRGTEEMASALPLSPTEELSLVPGDLPAMTWTTTEEGFPQPPTIEDFEAVVVGPTAIQRVPAPPDEPLPSPTGGPPLPRHWRGPERRPSPARPALGLFGLRAPRMVGREEQRDGLWSALREVWMVGAPRVVALQGPHGCGKTRLLEWLGERTHELGAASVLVAHHSPVTAATDGLRHAFTRLLGCEGLPADAIEERLDAVLPGADPETRAALAAVLAGASAAGLSSEGRRLTQVRFESPEQRHDLLRRCLERLGAERPVVLGLDDAQWGEDALAFVERLVASEPIPVLVVLTVSDEALAARPTAAERLVGLLDRSGTRTSRVEPFTEPERPVFSRDALGLGPELAERVQQRTEGNALFAVQLVQAWIDEALLDHGPGGLRLRAGADAPPLPDSVHAVWSARLDRVLAARPADDEIALEAAAALGREVDTITWRRTCTALGVEGSRALVDALLAERLAIEPVEGPHGLDEGRRWVFVHGMLRESLERRAREAGRHARIHRAIVKVLRDEEDDALMGRVGYHLIEAGDLRRALEPLLRGAAEELESGAFAVAEAQLARRRRLLGELGVPHTDRAWVDGWLLEARVGWRAGRWSDAEEKARRAAEVALANGWRDAAIRGFLARAHIAHATGRLAAAWRYTEDAESWAVVAREPLLLAEARYTRGRVMQARGALDAADDNYRRALDGFEHGEDLYHVALCLTGLGEVALARGDAETARATLTTARERFIECGARLRVAQVSLALGETARLRGDLLRAEVFYREALERFEAVGAIDELEARLSLGLVRLARGDLGAVRPLLIDLVEEAAQRGLRPLMAEAHAALLECAAAAGDWPAWTAHLSAAARALDETGQVDHDIARVASRAGERALAAGEPAHAREAWRLARDMWRGLGRADEAEELSERISDTRAPRPMPPV